MASKPQVLVVGATGRNGGYITRALLKSGNFRVAILVRQGSLDKPAVQELKAAGAEIRTGDIAETPQSELEKLFAGIDTLILSVYAMVDQKPAILAAKKAAVKRVVPSDFANPAARGVMWMNDLKLDVRDFIKEQGVPYTFIDAGWWTPALFPYPHDIHPKPNKFEAYANTFKSDGKQKVAYAAQKSVGELVAHIIADDRTLNHAVLAWDGESTLEEVWRVAQKVSGEDFSDYPKISVEEIKRLANSEDMYEKILGQYMNSVFVRGDDTLSNAQALGDLDARALYPDYKSISLEEQAKEFYKNPWRVSVE